MKLTISQEGSSPITITVPNGVKQEKYMVTTEAWEQETVKRLCFNYASNGW